MVAASSPYMTGTRPLSLLFAALALAVLLYQPLCRDAHPQTHHAGEPATCCTNVGAASGAEALDQAIDAGGKPLAAPLVFAYLAAAALFLVAVPRFASSLPPPRSFYARSARILR
jgi:hypothetical protein